MNKAAASRRQSTSSSSNLDQRRVVYIFFQMTNLKSFTPQGCTHPVALVSPNCEQLVLDVLDKCWDKTSSGLGSHVYVEDMIQSIDDPEMIQEYWEEYSL